MTPTANDNNNDTDDDTNTNDIKHDMYYQFYCS